MVEAGLKLMYRHRYLVAGVSLAAVVITAGTVWQDLIRKGFSGIRYLMLPIGILAGGWITHYKLRSNLRSFAPAISLISGQWLATSYSLIYLFQYAGYRFPEWMSSTDAVHTFIEVLVLPAGLIWLTRKPKFSPVALMVACEITLLISYLVSGWKYPTTVLLLNLRYFILPIVVAALLVFGYLVREEE